MTELLTIDQAFAILANSNRYAEARATDGTLRTYIGAWRNGMLTNAKKRAMLSKYGFRDLYVQAYKQPQDEQ